MLIYLDQNKWIELAKLVNGKNDPSIGHKIVKYSYNSVTDGKAIFPISAVHYMETGRISNKGRRPRLAEVMWAYSQGKTIAPYSKIIRKELNIAFSHFFNVSRNTELTLIGYGVHHAFGQARESKLPSDIQDVIEKSFLVGVDAKGKQVPGFREDKWRNKFLNHLNNLPSIRAELPKNKWEDCLYAISMADIIEPMREIMLEEDIAPDDIGDFGKDTLKQFIDFMPTRKMDVFLHKLVLQNPNLKHKITDLEDWAGVGVATQYCDLVICEKHFHDMATRNGFTG
jgi:hypothetical protein